LLYNTESLTARVALVTCAEVPELDSDTQLLIDPLAALGISATPAIWDDPNIDWSTFDLAVVRSPWDYLHRRAEFLAWANRVPRLANPADVLEWNTDKRYLQELADSGVPVVPTVWLQPDQQWTSPEQGEWVIKPAVSLASLDTGRYRLDDPGQHRLAVDHVRRLQQAGRTVMVQPYLRGVDTEGETSLVYVGGAFSHAMRRGPVLDGPDTGIDRRFQHDWETGVLERLPAAAQLALAEQVLTAVPGGPERLLYARVDLLPGLDGAPVLIEIELTEPVLFLGHARGAAVRFASTIAACVSSTVMRDQN
jgi:hypothetical protein